jgi:branched-chain amino acid transport system substrate-binding protein
VRGVQTANVRGAGGPIAFDKFGDTKTLVLTIYRVDSGKWTAVLTGS